MGCADAVRNTQLVVSSPQVVGRGRMATRRVNADNFCPSRTGRPPRFPCVQLVVGRPPSRNDPGVDMKTLTEFSGTMIRMAARAEAEARKNLPPELTRVAPAKAVSEGVSAKPNENASAVAADSGADSASGAAAAALAEQAAGGATAVSGTSSEPHVEKP